MISRLLLALLLLAPLAPLAPLAHAQTTKVGISLSHGAAGVGEEVFLFAVPKRMGFFAQEGLDVDAAFAPNIVAAAQALEAGSVQFATTTADVVLGLREKGGHVIAVSSLRRDNGHAVAVLENSPIHTLADLRGRTIGSVQWASMAGLFLTGELGTLGIGPDDYIRVNTPPGPAAAGELRSGQVDALAMWDAIFAAMENAGLKLRYLDIPLSRQLADYVLASSDALVAGNPRVVGGFCRAITEGIVYTKANPDAALRMLLAEYPQLLPAGANMDDVLKRDRHVLDRYMDNTLSGLPEGAPIGTFRPQMWADTSQFFQKLGRVKGSVPPQDGYTTSFLATCNDFDRAAMIAAH